MTTSESGIPTEPIIISRPESLGAFEERTGLSGETAVTQHAELLGEFRTRVAEAAGLTVEGLHDAGPATIEARLSDRGAVIE